MLMRATTSGSEQLGDKINVLDMYVQFYYVSVKFVLISIIPIF